MVTPFAPKSEEIWTDWIILQPIHFKSDRLLVCMRAGTLEMYSVLCTREANLRPNA